MAAATVESMDNEQDVERLFSWLKAPMVHYREFTPQIEVAEATAAWPVLHKAAAETGAVAGLGPAPHGDAAAHERLARERMMMPTAAAEAVREAPLIHGPAVAQPTPGRLEDRPATAGFAAPEGEPLVAEGPPRPMPQGELQRAAAPPITAFEEPEPVVSRAAPPPRAPAAPAGGAHTPLFAGEYRGREREARPAAPVADRQDRSLDAVFSRLSGARGGLPDPRVRARTSPGLGGVFGRLR